MEQNEAFTKALLSLTDDTFFYVMRNYLGPVATPFHKPTLVKNLITLLSNPDMQQRIIELADHLDRRLLTLICVLDNPAIGELHQLTRNIIPYYQLQNRIVNLEERLLLISDPDTLRLAVNPFFQELTSSLIHCDYLLIDSPETGCEPEESPFTYLGNPLFLAAALVGAIHYGETDRRKIYSVHKFLVSARQPMKSAWDLIYGLFTHKIRTMNEEQISPNMSLMENEHTFSLRGLLESALLTSMHISVSEPLILFLGTFIDLLLLFPGRKLFEKDLKYLYTTSLLLQKNGIRSVVEEIQQGIIDGLSEIGILISDGKFFTVSEAAVQALQAPQNPKKETGILSFDSDFSVHIDPSRTSSDIFKLLFFLEAASIDLIYIFTLTKNSFLKALDAGATLEDLLTILDNLEVSLPSHIRSTLETWNSAYKRIEVTAGILLKTDQVLGRIIEAHEEFQKFIISRISPENYLLRGEYEREWRELLNSFGIDYLPKTRGSGSFPCTKGHKDSPSDLVFPYHSKSFSEILRNNDLDAELQIEKGKDLQEIMRKRTGEAKLSSQDREEVMARIDKKLIITESQLKGNRFSSSIYEARGLDYQGKINLCRAAISSRNDLLEIHSRNSHGEELIALVKPRELVNIKRQNSELTGTLLPDEEDYSIPVRKISLLRKLRGNLFSPEI